MYKKMFLGFVMLVASLFLITPVAATVTIDFGTSDEISFNEDGSATLDLDDYIDDTAQNGDLDIDYTGDDHVTVSIDANNVATFTADADWPTGHTEQMETITFTVDDDDSTPSLDDLEVTVNAVNDVPVMDIPTSFTARADVEFEYDVKAKTTDVDLDTVTFSAEAPTALDSFAIDINTGIIKFTPTESEVGIYSVILKADDGEGGVASKTVKFWVTEFCDDGNLVIDDVSWDDETGDDDQLEPGDYIDVEFEIKNEMNIDINDVEVKAWVEDSDEDRVSNKVEVDLGDISDDDTEDVDLKLKIEPETESGHYTLVIETQGEDDDSVDRCDVFREEIEVEREDHRLLLEDVTIVPSEVEPGRTVEVSVNVYNIGEKNEDDIKLKIKISELDITEYSEEFELDDDEDEIKTIKLEIPSTAKAGDYWFEVVAEFNDGDDSDASDQKLLKITEDESDDVIIIPTTSATANLGETVKFTTTLMNNGGSSAIYTMSLSDVSGWADSTVEPGSVSLEAGKSTPVYVYITPDETGTNTAVLSVYENGELAATKTLTVTAGGLITGRAIGVDATEFGHSVSLSQTKNLISTYIGTTGLIVLIALLAVLALVLYFANKAKRPSEVTYIVDKKKGSKRR